MRSLRTIFALSPCTRLMIDGGNYETFCSKEVTQRWLWDFELLGYMSLCDVTSTIHQNLFGVFTNAQYMIHLNFENSQSLYGLEGVIGYQWFIVVLLSFYHSVEQDGMRIKEACCNLYFRRPLETSVLSGSYCTVIWMSGVQDFRPLDVIPDCC